jgi:hypothetical protein
MLAPTEKETTAQMRGIPSVVPLIFIVLVATASALGAAPRGTRTNPYPIRTMIRPPDGQGWKLRVNRSIPNATRAVLRWNKFNPPPRAGNQFFIVNLTLAYSGKEPTSPFPPTRISVVGRSNVPSTVTDDSCGGIPGQLHFRTRVRTGGSITGNMCFSVRKTDVRSLLLMYQAAFSVDNRQVFFRVR